MQREDFVFCIGFEGSTAIIDGRMMRKYRSHTARQLAEEGLYKQAVSSAVFAGSAEQLEEVRTVYNQKTTVPVRTVDDLKRMFGISIVPEGVKKITVV